MELNWKQALEQQDIEFAALDQEERIDRIHVRINMKHFSRYEAERNLLWYSRVHRIGDSIRNAVSVCINGSTEQERMLPRHVY